MTKYIRSFLGIGLNDVGLVGGKTASLGELYSALAAEGVAVPNGFALTADAYRDALSQAGARTSCTGCSTVSTRARSGSWRPARAKAREIVYKATGTRADPRADRGGLPAAGTGGRQGRRRRRAQFGDGGGSADASFAGQHDSFLNVRGPRGPVRGLPALLRLDLHRSCDRPTASTTASIISRSRCRSPS